MKVVVITITCDRLELTKKYLSQLKLKGGYPFEHIIVDNGSTDGTIEYLSNYEILSLDKNYGIVPAWKIGIKEALSKGADLIVKFDNDCEIYTKNILKRMVDFYKKGCDNYVIAPLDIKIPDNYMPRNLGEAKERGFNIRYVSHTGGMFQMLPKKVAEMMIDCKDNALIGGDLLRGHFWIRNGISPIYLTDLKIGHMGIGKQTKNYKLR
jgi:GT2 family glycosyltransferase